VTLFWFAPIEWLLPKIFSILLKWHPPTSTPSSFCRIFHGFGDSICWFPDITCRRNYLQKNRSATSDTSLGSEGNTFTPGFPVNFPKLGGLSTVPQAAVPALSSELHSLSLSLWMTGDKFTVFSRHPHCLCHCHFLKELQTTHQRTSQKFLILREIPSSCNSFWYDPLWTKVLRVWFSWRRTRRISFGDKKTARSCYSLSDETFGRSTMQLPCSCVAPEQGIVCSKHVLKMSIDVAGLTKFKGKNVNWRVRSAIC
jgi:hypothetical protein